MNTNHFMSANVVTTKNWIMTQKKVFSLANIVDKSVRYPFNVIAFTRKNFYFIASVMVASDDAQMPV